MPNPAEGMEEETLVSTIQSGRIWRKKKKRKKRFLLFFRRGNQDFNKFETKESGEGDGVFFKGEDGERKRGRRKTERKGGESDETNFPCSNSRPASTDCFRKIQQPGG